MKSTAKSALVAAALVGSLAAALATAAKAAGPAIIPSCHCHALHWMAIPLAVATAVVVISHWGVSVDGGWLLPLLVAVLVVPVVLLGTPTLEAHQAQDHAGHCDHRYDGPDDGADEVEATAAAAAARGRGRARRRASLTAGSYLAVRLPDNSLQWGRRK